MQRAHGACWRRVVVLARRSLRNPSEDWTRGPEPLSLSLVPILSPPLTPALVYDCKERFEDL